MAALQYRTPFFGVSITGAAIWKDKAILHRIGRFLPNEAVGRASGYPYDRFAGHGMAVMTICGNKLIALPHTWQPSRPCRRCGMVDEHGVGWALGVHSSPERQEAALLWNAATGQWRDHAMHVIRTCNSKRLSREIARALGFDPPETIVEDHPDLVRFVQYQNPPKNMPV